MRLVHATGTCSRDGSAMSSGKTGSAPFHDKARSGTILVFCGLVRIRPGYKEIRLVILAATLRWFFVSIRPFIPSFSGIFITRLSTYSDAPWRDYVEFRYMNKMSLYRSRVSAK